MSVLQVILFLGLALVTFTTANPLPKLTTRAPPETGGPHRRGVAYNEANYVKYFDIGGSQVTWVCTTALLEAAY